MQKSTAVLIVKIIAAFGLIGSLISVIVGIGAMLGKPIAGSVFQTIIGFGGGLILRFFGILGLFILVIGLFGLYLYYQVYLLREWARIFVIVLSVIGLIQSIVALNIFLLVIDGTILYFLAIDKSIYSLFS